MRSSSSIYHLRWWYHPGRPRWSGTPAPAGVGVASEARVADRRPRVPEVRRPDGAG